MTSRLRYYFDLISVLTRKELKVRYKNSLLGYIWSIANPLAFAFVYFIAFKVVMKIKMEDYSLFLIAGLFPWQWFSNSAIASTGVLLGNASVIKKVRFPRSVIPLAMVLQDMIHFLISVPVVIFFLFLFHKTPSFAWIYGIPVLLSIQLLITFGFSLILSSVNLFFRDIERLVLIIITLMFYFTPIIYSESMIPAKYEYMVILNPLAFLMISWRNLFLKGTLDAYYLVISFLYALLFFLSGCLVYKKLSYRFAEVL